MARNLLDVQLAVGDGLAVRPWRPEDAPGLYGTVVANRAYLGAWLPWAESYESVASAEEFIRKAKSEARERRGLHCAITLDGAAIGATGFDTLSDIQGEIGYWLAEHHGGRGIMTRCCSAVIGYGFGELGLHRIQIWADALNRRSRAVPERLGSRGRPGTPGDSRVAIRLPRGPLESRTQGGAHDPSQTRGPRCPRPGPPQGRRRPQSARRLRQPGAAGDAGAALHTNPVGGGSALVEAKRRETTAAGPATGDPETASMQAPLTPRPPPPDPGRQKRHFRLTPDRSGRASSLAPAS